jgi:hypothetical protein
MFSPITEFDWNTRDKCQEVFNKDYSKMVHYPAKLMRQEFLHLGWDFDQYTKISSVRNPWSRTVSLYEDSVQSGWQGTFDKFVATELPKWRSGLINRWNSYEMQHENGERIVDHVIRIEYLEAELRSILEKQWPDLLLNYGVMSNTNAHNPYQTYYASKTTCEVVEEFFKYDIENFGYRFDDVLAK